MLRIFKLCAEDLQRGVHRFHPGIYKSVRILIHTILVRRFDIRIQSVRIQLELCVDLPWFFYRPASVNAISSRRNISTLKLYIDIFALYRHTFCYLHAKNAEL